MALLDLKKINENNGISCYIHKAILERIKSYVLESIKNTQNLNPQYVKVLERAKNRR